MRYQRDVLAEKKRHEREEQSDQFVRPSKQAGQPIRSFFVHLKTLPSIGYNVDGENFLKN